MATMATDPVCGMKIEQEKAVALEWEGRSFSFCFKGFRSEFLEEPQQFLNAVPPIEARIPRCNGWTRGKH
jgi:YHS domain-containing protein